MTKEDYMLYVMLISSHDHKINKTIQGNVLCLESRDFCVKVKSLVSNGN